MTRPSIAFFLLMSFLSSGQNNIPLGQGVIKVDQERLSNLWFFSDTSSTVPAKTITILRTENGDYFLKNSSEVIKWFVPEAFSLDYYNFILRVDTVVGRWVRVVVNNDNGTSYWTRSEPSKKFLSWPTFLLKETTAIQKIEDYYLDIKTHPDNSAKTIRKFAPTDCLQVIEIKGDWMRVKTNDVLECNQHPTPIKSGWIQWRQNGRLTIGYSLTC